MHQRDGGPPVVTARGPAADWLAAERSRVRALVAEHGAVVLRGLAVDGRETFHGVAAALTGELIAEREGFAPREAYQGPVYSSSKWPANQPMCMHHEMSYVREFPGTLLIGCLTAPTSGGTTSLADAADVLDTLPASMVDRFATHGWLLTRTYQELLGTPWSDAFGTDDRAVVDAYCRANDIDHTWLDDGGLRTRQRRAAVLAHPQTGRRCWFNQVAFLNEATMEPAVRDYLVAEFGPEGLPFNTFLGDGSPIDAEDIELINAVYDKHARCEPWQAGDVLVVDNIRTAHSREPYAGEREMLVALGDPVPADTAVSRP